ncbi:MAG: hypothetical protein JNL96_24050 [Planctomycetaceae bacterium]|nr:hypothetical protein [Planctomycetaceae bacterium]
MHTVDLLEAAIAAVKKLGYRVRLEALDEGATAGVCEFAGKRWLFLDAKQGPLDQLHQVLDVLRTVPRDDRLALADPLERLIERRRAA